MTYYIFYVANRLISKGMITMFKIAMVADLHHFSPTLTDFGKAYHLRESSDQKCLAESGAIIEAAFEKMANSDCDAVLIAGDISNDGERASHEEMKQMLQKLGEKKPVYVVYATHDWCCDGNAKRFEGDKYYNDVETMTPPQLREFYQDYGVSNSYDEYVNHLGASSYAVKLSDKICFIGANDDQNGKGCSGYSDEHFDWLLKQVKEAKARGETVIVMEHHLVIPNLSMLINGGQIIGDHDERAEAMAAAGVDFVIVGHSHSQRTTTYKAQNGNIMTQINLGALCGHPAPITTLTVTDEEYKIDVESLEKFSYNGKEYTKEFITGHTKGVLMGLLNTAAKDKEEFIDRACAIDSSITREKVLKLYPIVKPLAKYVLKLTVGRAGRLINFLTFGKGVNKKAVKQLKNDNLLEHIMKIYLSVFDGSVNFSDDTNPVAIIVKDVVTIPQRINLPIKALKKEKTQKLLKQVEELAAELVTPSKPDNWHCVIKRDYE